MHAVLLLALAAPVAMKYNEVREVAPGVFFRYSSIHPTDTKVVFGGSNNIWVVFDEYVAVIDANFPKEASDVIAAIRKTTKKPIRYVLDTHHHGDHAWGNAVWIKEGATVISSRQCAKLLRDTGPGDWEREAKNPKGRKDVKEGKLGFPALLFDDKLVLDDGVQRIEFLRLGHSHTIGDAVAWLPKQRILCTGDACVNGPYNYMGHSDSASWVRCLERMEGLGPKLVLPGHGLPEDKALLARQKRYFADLRAYVKKGIADGKDVKDLARDIDFPWYKEWTTVKPAEDNVKHVYAEFMGTTAPWDLEAELGLTAGPSPTKDTEGWKKPKRIVVPAGLLPGELAQLKRAAPEVEYLPARNAAEAAKLAAEADAVVGFASADIAAVKGLRWAQAGPEDDLAAIKGGGPTITESRRVNGPGLAERTFSLMLSLSRGRSELRGKTLLLVGLGGPGRQIARRADAFGMRVRAIDDRPGDKPDEVVSLEKMDRLKDRLAEADVVALALPLTEATKGVVGAKEMAAMKKGAYLVNAAGAALIDLEAYKGVKHLGGLGLDAALPEGHFLRGRDGVVVLKDEAVPEARERTWRLWRENVRRFAAGEPLLAVVPVK